jgi:hypothetical protein
MDPPSQGYGAATTNKQNKACETTNYTDGTDEEEFMK